jgi:hypothetical protein
VPAKRNPILMLLFFLSILYGCDAERNPAVAPTPHVSGTTFMGNPTSETIATLSPSSISSPNLDLSTPDTETPVVALTDHSQPRCALGVGLRAETVPLLLKYREYPGMVMTGSASLSEELFPLLDGWIRIMGVPSLEAMEKKAERAFLNGTLYEALAYGLETNESTPDVEWQKLVGSTQRAKAIADQYNKLLVMGPGFKLMSDNEEKYPQMASLADIWVLQTQQLQKGPPGSDYRNEVVRIIHQIRSSNPEIQIWAQITLPPDRDPDAREWMAYYLTIVDVIDGAYIGVYTWSTNDPEVLLKTIDEIFSTICMKRL